jgi:hypothetical protein
MNLLTVLLPIGTLILGAVLAFFGGLLDGHMTRVMFQLRPKCAVRL